MTDRETKNVVVSVVLLLVVASATALVTYMLYLRTSNILQERLKERLIAIVSTAALQFDTNDVKQVNDKTDVGKPSFLKITRQLQSIRNANQHVLFAYLLRPNPTDTTIFSFIADADSIDPYLEIDLNKDGLIDEEDALAFPGMEYDASEVPAIQKAYLGPLTDDEPVTDDWGVSFSAYAPIKERGETIAILGLDVDVTDFQRLISATLRPFLIFVFCLLVILTIQTFSVIGTWNSRVKVLKDLDKQKDELLGLVSHQLATPISGLRWNLEMLADEDVGPLNTKQKEELETMEGVVRNLSDLVSMILDVSRIQLGKMKVDKTKIDLHSFYSEIVDVLRPKAVEKSINFDVRIPEQGSFAILDKRLTHMTIENLISNAVKYTPKGGRVSVNAFIKENVMHCQVVDTGCGIPKFDQDKIFGKLYRASNVSAIDGNGFGLYIAKGAIESQGGKIGFKSKEGEGTTFFVELPICKLPWNR